MSVYTWLVYLQQKIALLSAFYLIENFSILVKFPFKIQSFKFLINFDGGRNLRVHTSRAKPRFYNWLQLLSPVKDGFAWTRMQADSILSSINLTQNWIQSTRLISRRLDIEFNNKRQSNSYGREMALFTFQFLRSVAPSHQLIIAALVEQANQSLPRMGSLSRKP